MKVRSRFVSNSSTSSFVLLGFNVSHLDQEEVIDICEDEDIGFLVGEDDGLREGETAVGFLYTWEDCTVDTSASNSSLEELTEALETVRERFELGEECKPRLFYGIRAS